MKNILTAFLVFSATACFASWKDIPLETVVADSDLIVVAKLTNVKKEPKNNTVVYCQGELTITEVLKGTKGDTVVLKATEVRKGKKVDRVIIKWAYSIPPMSISVDHSNLEGKSILWLLKREKDKSFSAHYPKRVQNVKRRDEIINIVEQHHNRLAGD